MNTINIVAADDHKIFLQGLKSLFVLTDNIELKATAPNGDILLDIIEKYRPDIALVDLSMPGATTETIIKTVEEKYPSTQLLALTMHMDPVVAIDLFALGLSGYVLKECAFDELEIAIKSLIQGEQFISPQLLKAINNYSQKPGKEIILTSKELDVIKQVAKANSNKEIARNLNITERTVRFHLSNCFVKLNANNRLNAANRAIELGLINNLKEEPI
ncbi:MAG TPA: response regulator transcription factor [Bacteroidetes bacterium]|nr:response regulator transcription factor [Bacteroidota bacterium]